MNRSLWMKLQFRFVYVCVLCDVCYFPSILVTVPRIKGRRVLDFAACSGDYTLQRFFCPSEPTGKHWGFFFLLFYFHLLPHPLLRCLPSLYREKGPAVPFPRRQ